MTQRLVLCVALAMVGLATTGCEVNHKSDQYACTTNADCSAGRTCNEGSCIVVGSIDASGGTADAPRPDSGNNNGCPAQCTSCNTAQKTCTVNCTQTNCKQALACPAGYNCTFLCNGDDTCRQGINCLNASACTIECSGKSSCEQVRCGPGPCDVSCSGPSSCRDVLCGSSCACDVTCTGNQSCADGIVCTSLACRTSFRGCTSEPLTCHSCN